MGSTTRKYIAAMVAASASEAIKRNHPRWAVMNRERLYTVLEEGGYRWDTELQEWVIRETVDVRNKRGLSNLTSVVSQTNKTFLVRIMAPRQDIQAIEAELIELSQALGWETSRSGKEYENEPAGQWVRRYYKVERG